MFTALREKPNRYRLLVFGALAFYLSSLFLPGIVYKPWYRTDGLPVTYDKALTVVQEGATCWASGGDVKLVAPDKIVYLTPTYLIKDPSMPVWTCTGSDFRYAVTDDGGKILATGWLGLFAGVFAWYANPLALFVFAFAWSKRLPRLTGILSLIAFAVGLNAFAFHAKPLDEGGVKFLVVDHLAVGYYLWEASLLLLAAARFSLLLKKAPPDKQPA